MIMKNLTCIAYFVVFIYLSNSCSEMKTLPSYLEQCQEKVMQQNNDKFCATDVTELKENIPGKKPLFYVGSDSTSNYLVFYYDKTKKIVVGFKVPYNDFKPPAELQFKEDNYYLKKYPIYLDDI